MTCFSVFGAMKNDVQKSLIIKQTLGKLKVDNFRLYHKKCSIDEGN